MDVTDTGSQLSRSTERLQCKSSGRTKPTVPAEYVVGLTDGEGCFFVNLWQSPNFRSGWQVSMHFHLKLQERDKELLWKVRNTLGCGNVYYQRETRKNHTQCYRYTVSSLRDVTQVIIPFFKTHPLQTVSKRTSFDVYCKIAVLMEAKAHLTPEGVERIRALKLLMNQRTVGLA
jgi:hypothetical protein